MKYYDLYDYFETRYGGILAQQILDEMPPSGLKDLLSPDEIVAFYRQNLKGYWEAYKMCRSLRDKKTRHKAAALAGRIRRELLRYQEAQRLHIEFAETGGQA